MKIKSKFAIYNIIMLITPILLIGVISVCFVLIFILKFPVEELNISRPSMLDPYVCFRRWSVNFSKVIRVQYFMQCCGLRYACCLSCFQLPLPQD